MYVYIYIYVYVYIYVYLYIYMYMEICLHMARAFECLAKKKSHQDGGGLGICRVVFTNTSYGQ